MNNSRRHTFSLLAAALAAGALISPTILHAADGGLRTGKVVTSSNATGGNMLMVYEAGPGGDLALVSQVPTGGTGTGGGLGSQGAVTLSGSGRYLFAVNAQSNSLSTFIVREKKLGWVVVTPNGKFAYTTHTGSGTISSYRIRAAGNITLLDPMAGHSGEGSSPIDVAMTRDGKRLYSLSANGIGLHAFAAASDGSLTPTAHLAALPPGTVGLAAN